MSSEFSSEYLKAADRAGMDSGLGEFGFYSDELDEQGLINPELPSSPCDALVLPMTENITAAVSLAESLRNAGLRVQLYGEQKKFKQKMSYADKLAVPFAVLLGDDEISQGKCSLKNMKTGQQQLLTAEEAAQEVISCLQNNGPIILEK